MSLRFLSSLPSWVTYCDGAVPILLVAPHGGRRPADAPIRDSLKVNDLYTAELTTLLAARTGSYALINHAGDRNDLDLNRISQVRTRAPWFLDALVELLSVLVAHHGSARVFFIHGWNVVQPVCDLGMGLKQKGERVVPASKVAAPTLSASFFTDAILPFRTAALAQGIDVALGRRYPAADKDNLMQVFSPRFADDLAPAIRTLAALSLQEKNQRRPVGTRSRFALARTRARAFHRSFLPDVGPMCLAYAEGSTRLSAVFFFAPSGADHYASQWFSPGLTSWARTYAPGLTFSRPAQWTGSDGWDRI